MLVIETMQITYIPDQHWNIPSYSIYREICNFVVAIEQMNIYAFTLSINKHQVSIQHT